VKGANCFRGPEWVGAREKCKELRQRSGRHYRQKKEKGAKEKIFKCGTKRTEGVSTQHKKETTMAMVTGEIQAKSTSRKRKGSDLRGR